MTDRDSTKYKLDSIDLQNPSNAHDFLLILAGKEKKVLELGCASGYLTKILKERGCSVTGIELDPTLAKKAEKFSDKIIIGDLETNDLDDTLGSEKYDVILAGDILEHLKDPVSLLIKLKSFLREGGSLVCSIPNISHGSIRLKLLDGEFSYKKTGLLDETHLKFYTLNSILSLLNLTGFKMDELKRVKTDIIDGNGSDLKLISISNELIQSIMRDPESTTFQFVFRATPTAETNDILDWALQFPSNLTTNDLTNRIDDYKKTIEDKNKKIENLIEQYKVLVERYGILEEKRNTLSEQNNDLSSQKKLLEESLALAQKTIMEYHQSFVFRMLRKYDNSIGKIIPLKPKKHLKSTHESLPKDIREEEIKKIRNIVISKKDIICLPIINWDYRVQRPQHLMKKFAENGHRVFYFTASLRNLTKPYEVVEKSENIFQVELNSPTFFDIYKDDLNDSLILELMKSFDILKQELKLDPIIFIQFPSWLNLALKLKEKFGYKIIFDCLDEFSNFPGVKQKRKTEEETLFEKSDLVLTTSSALHEKSIKKESKSLFLPNAGEFEHFSKKTENLLHEYKKPIIGYFGSIAEWFDVELIEYLTKQRPDWTFIFIGHTFGSDIRKIRELPNVNFLGERPYSELPKYLRGFDVCLIPFKITPLTEATHPVKIYEYMATGKPVVSTKLKELQTMSDLCYIAENKEDFLSKIEKALNEKDKELRNKRIQFSSENTWNHRFETLYKELEKIEGLDLHHHN